MCVRVCVCVCVCDMVEGPGGGEGEKGRWEAQFIPTGKSTIYLYCVVSKRMQILSRRRENADKRSNKTTKKKYNDYEPQKR